MMTFQGAPLEEFSRILLERIFADVVILSLPLWRWEGTVHLPELSSLSAYESAPVAIVLYYLCRG